MSFGRQLLQERKKLHLSADQLAMACGVSRSYITLIETGRRLPSKKIISSFASALRLKPNIIINWYLEALREKLTP